MPKRIAGNQLTHENWDEEEKDDDTGGQIGIPKASADEMKGRVIKVARRKGIAGAAGSSEQMKSAFSGFSGFGSLKPASGFSGQPPKLQSNLLPPTTNGTKDTAPTKKSKSDEYYGKLRALNESVSAWIKSHVDKNPYCILTPVFKDYEKHLLEVEKLNTDNRTDGHVVATDDGAAAGGASSNLETPSSAEKPDNKRVSFNLQQDKKADAPSLPSFSFTDTSAQKSTNSGLFTFGAKTTEKEIDSDKTAAAPKFSFSVQSESKSESKAEAPKFSFGVKSDSDSKTEPPKFSFGTTTSDSTAKFSFGTSTLGGASSGGFSFSATPSSGAAKPFSFATGGATSGSQTGGDGEEEEYVPPKPEVVEVKEEGATYTKRCKLFWMVDGKWKERGLGNLHLKPMDTGKTQLVIRADTNLGNILLNIMLNDSIPMNRSGKNMVNFICVPNPPFDPKSDPKPEKLLLKVKSTEEADELLEKLQEAKK